MQARPHEQVENKPPNACLTNAPRPCACARCSGRVVPAGYACGAAAAAIVAQHGAVAIVVAIITTPPHCCRCCQTCYRDDGLVAVTAAQVWGPRDGVGSAGSADFVCRNGRGSASRCASGTRTRNSVT
eukprot:365001-Chlamydomonas_euryale.AAC.15